VKVAHRAFALIGTVTLASTLVACGGAPREVDADQPDQSQNDQAGDGKISISEINADNVEGMCEQTFGSVEDVFTKLDFSGDFTITEYNDWGDEFFPEESSTKPATFRCQASGYDEGSDAQVQVDILVAAGDNEPRGNTDFTVAADGMTAGIQSYSDDGSSYESELVEQSSGEQYLTDDVLTKFQP
jgi:hypothetical protein